MDRMASYFLVAALVLLRPYRTVGSRKIVHPGWQSRSTKKLGNQEAPVVANGTLSPAIGEVQTNTPSIEALGEVHVQEALLAKIPSVEAVGEIHVQEDVTKNTPIVEALGEVHVQPNLPPNTPSAEAVGEIHVQEDVTKNTHNAEAVGEVHVQADLPPNTPSAEAVGEIHVQEDVTKNTPSVEALGEVHVQEDLPPNAPSVEVLAVRDGTSITRPADANVPVDTTASDSSELNPLTEYPPGAVVATPIGQQVIFLLVVSACLVLVAAVWRKKEVIVKYVAEKMKVKKPPTNDFLCASKPMPSKPMIITRGMLD